MPADDTNRNTSTGRGFLQTGHPDGGGSPEERKNPIDILRK